MLIGSSLFKSNAPEIMRNKGTPILEKPSIKLLIHQLELIGPDKAGVATWMAITKIIAKALIVLMNVNFK